MKFIIIFLLSFSGFYANADTYSDIVASAERCQANGTKFKNCLNNLGDEITSKYSSLLVSLEICDNLNADLGICADLHISALRCVANGVSVSNCLSNYNGDQQSEDILASLSRCDANGIQVLDCLRVPDGVVD